MPKDPPMFSRSGAINAVVTAVALISFLAGAWVPKAMAQGSIEDRLRRLEMRVDKLEGSANSTSAVQSNASGSQHKNRQNWRSLHLGMNEDDVRKLLGEPHKIDNNQFFKRWYWDYPGGSSVRFDGKSGLLDQWTEP